MRENRPLSEEVRFESTGIALAGTFVDPGDAKAAALILTGSGRLDRDSNGRGFRGQINSAIAQALAARGIARCGTTSAGPAKAVATSSKPD